MAVAQIIIFSVFLVLSAVADNTTTTTTPPTFRPPTPDRVQVYAVAGHLPTTTEYPETTEPNTESAPEHRQGRAVPLDAAPKSRGAFASPVQQKKITPGQVLKESPFTCNGLKNGHYADVTYHCRFFHQCSFFYNSEGQLYIQQAVFECGHGTRFNQTLRTCDHAKNVICQRRYVQQIIDYQNNEPTPPPGFGNPVQLPFTTFRCTFDHSHQGFYYADVDSNCAMYHRCVYHFKKDQPYVTHFSFLCPVGTLFDQKTITCEHAEQVTHCHNSPALVHLQAPLHNNL